MKRTFRLKDFLLFGLLVFSLSYLSSCTESSSVEIARFSPGTITAYKRGIFVAEDTLSLKATDKLEIWTEVDFSYRGKQNLFFRLVLLRGDEYISEFYVDPEKAERFELDSREERDSTVYRKINAYNGVFSVEQDGDYNIKVLLMGLKNPSLDLNKTDLILRKQE